MMILQVIDEYYFISSHSLILLMEVKVTYYATLT